MADGALPTPPDPDAVTQAEAAWVGNLAEGLANVITAAAATCPGPHPDCLIAATFDGAIRRLALHHEHLPLLVGGLLVRG